MKQIYAGAESLVVWLSDFPVHGSDASEHDGFFLLEDFANQLARLTAGSCKHKPEVLTDLAWHFDELLGLRGYQMPSETSYPVSDAIKFRYLRIYRAIERLLSVPWFDRVWIIQEVASARSGVIVCGQNGRTVSMPMRVFAFLPALMGLEISSHTQAILEIMPIAGQRRRGWRNERNDLEMLLTKFQKSKSTEPHDYVYALLGIASDTIATQILQPDYLISLSEVFRKTTLFLLVSKAAECSPELPEDKNALIDALNDPDGFPHGVFVYAMQLDLYDTMLYLTNKCDIRIDRWKGESIIFELANHLTRAGPGVSDCIWKIIRKILAQEHIFVNTCIQSSLVHGAVRHGDAALSWLSEISNVLDVNSRDSHGGTALETALFRKEPASVRALLEVEGINLNARTSKGETLLCAALRRENCHVLRLLLGHRHIDVSEVRIGSSNWN